MEIELKGKYTNAKIFAEIIDEETMGQVMSVINDECSDGCRVRIMPDCHAGKGCVVGTTMTLNGRVVPGLVGVDIGCGVYGVKLGKVEIDLPVLDTFIRSNIKMGQEVNSDSSEFQRTDLDLTNLRCWKGICGKKTYFENSLGSLGGGNHFIEIGRNREGELWLFVHTGSRNLGLEVCKYYQEVAVQYIKSGKCDLDAKRKELIENLKRQGRQKEISKALIKFNEEHNPAINEEMAYLEGKDFENYIHDIAIIQRFALENRRSIIRRICKFLKIIPGEEIECIHNYIDVRKLHGRYVLRKGSISAEKGERVIVPINMRDGSIIGIGKGNEDYNWSAPHGSGRVMSRSEAKNKVKLEDFEETMKGIYSSTVCESTLDESPFAYKAMEDILPDLKETVEIVEVVKPIYNVKGF